MLRKNPSLNVTRRRRRKVRRACSEKALNHVLVKVSPVPRVVVTREPTNRRQQWPITALSAKHHLTATLIGELGNDF